MKFSHYLALAVLAVSSSALATDVDSVLPETTLPTDGFAVSVSKNPSSSCSATVHDGVWSATCSVDFSAAYGLSFFQCPTGSPGVSFVVDVTCTDENAAADQLIVW